MSSTSKLGSSKAAKCPPLGIWVHRCRLYDRSAHSLGGWLSSLGKTATPVGTLIISSCFNSQMVCWVS